MDCSFISVSPAQQAGSQVDGSIEPAKFQLRLLIVLQYRADELPTDWRSGKDG